MCAYLHACRHIYTPHSLSSVCPLPIFKYDDASGSYEGQATHPTARSLAVHLLHFPVLDLRQGATAQRARAGGTNRILGRFQERKLWPLLRGSRGLCGRGTCVGPRGPATTQKKKRKSILRDGSLSGYKTWRAWPVWRRLGSHLPALSNGPREVQGTSSAKAKNWAISCGRF